MGRPPLFSEEGKPRTQKKTIEQIKKKQAKKSDGWWLWTITFQLTLNSHENISICEYDSTVASFAGKGKNGKQPRKNSCIYMYLCQLMRTSVGIFFILFLLLFDGISQYGWKKNGRFNLMVDALRSRLVAGWIQTLFNK